MAQNALEEVLNNVSHDLSQHFEKAVTDACVRKLGIPATIEVERERDTDKKDENGETVVETYVEYVPVDIAYASRLLNEQGIVFTTSEAVNPVTRRLELTVKFYRLEQEISYRVDTKWEASVTLIDEANEESETDNVSENV